MATYTPPTSYSLAYKEVPTQIQTRTHEDLWRDRARKWSQRVSRIRKISRMTSAVINIVMFAFMSFVISVFISTRHDEALGRSIWPRSPKTWPTYMLLVASLLTMITSILLLLYYCLFPKRAAESWKVIVLSYAIHIILWLLVTFLYRLEKAISDLWGWSCTDIAKDLQAKGDIAVDFSKLCSIQVWRKPFRSNISVSDHY